MIYLVFLSLFALSIAFCAHIFGHLKQVPTLAHNSKPFLVLTLFIATLAWWGEYGKFSWAFILLLLALIGGWLGDVLLMGTSKRSFLFGALAFTAGHVFYVLLAVYLLVTRGFPAWYWLVAAPITVVAFGALAIYYLDTYARDNSYYQKMRSLLLIYGLCLVALVTSFSLVDIADPTLPAQALMMGAILFMISDFTLCMQTFTDRRRIRQAVVMTTYTLAQTLLTMGALTLVAPL